MTLQESYPREWSDISNQKVPKDKINEYLLRFVSKLLKEIKSGNREEIDLGDGWSMIINLDKKKYTLNSEVYSFLFRLGDYGMENTLGKGSSEHGNMLYTLEEVESELKKIANKIGIVLN